MVAAGNEPGIANQRLLQYVTLKERGRKRDRARCKLLQIAADRNNSHGTFSQKSVPESAPVCVMEPLRQRL